MKRGGHRGLGLRLLFYTSTSTIKLAQNLLQLPGTLPRTLVEGFYPGLENPSFSLRKWKGAQRRRKHCALAVVRRTTNKHTNTQTDRGDYKLLYAARAWWGFTSADDKQRLAAFIRRSIRQGFCAPDFANFSDIIDSADDDLFKQILSSRLSTSSTWQNRITLQPKV